MSARRPRPLVRPRADSARRCAYCHDRAAPGQVLACPACGALLHAACAEGLARCPTLGCRGSLRPPVDRPLGRAGTALLRVLGFLADL